MRRSRATARDTHTQPTWWHGLGGSPLAHWRTSGDVVPAPGGVGGVDSQTLGVPGGRSPGTGLAFWLGPESSGASRRPRAPTFLSSVKITTEGLDNSPRSAIRYGQTLTNGSFQSDPRLGHTPARSCTGRTTAEERTADEKALRRACRVSASMLAASAPSLPKADPALSAPALASVSSDWSLRSARSSKMARRRSRTRSSTRASRFRSPKNGSHPQPTTRAAGGSVSVSFIAPPAPIIHPELRAPRAPMYQQRSGPGPR